MTVGHLLSWVWGLPFKNDGDDHRELLGKKKKNYNSYQNPVSLARLKFFCVFYSLALPPAEPKSPPEGLFFKVVEQANAIFHLLEKHFTDCVIGLVA